MMVSGLFFGLLTGALLGLLGGGGSIIAVPIMVYILGIETKTAIGTSLLIVGAASILAAFSHYRQQYVGVRVAVLFGFAGALGSYFGAIAGKNISDGTQLMLFACLMAVIAVFMLTQQAAEVEGETGKSTGLFKALAVGGGAGFLTGLLGVGGGFIIVPALTIFLKLPLKKAIGTSLVVIGMNSLVAAASYSPFVRFGHGILPFVAGTFTAAPVAAHFAHHMRHHVLKTAFAILLLGLSAFMLAKQAFGF